MRVRHVLVLALAAAAALACVMLLSGEHKHYRLRVPLENASGLKTGSPVLVGGEPEGRVTLRLSRDDHLTAELELDPGAGPVGRDAKVSIVAANFLGQKRVELDPGDRQVPVPSGWVVPSAQITGPTDLDQVLSVLDADTRTRAAILINETGAAVVGRKFDLRALLSQFPPGLVGLTKVLEDLQTDRKVLGTLVEHSDRFVAEATAQRRDLADLVDTLGQTAQTVSARRAALRRTLAAAPGTLARLQGFLTQLEATARPLGPAAAALQATAPGLASTLHAVMPFTNAAVPTLGEAARVAPVLTRLGDRATPVIRRARQAVSSLVQLAGDLPPLSTTADRSFDNLVAILDNWSRAIQFRDGLSHVFRGEAGISPNLLSSMTDRLVTRGSQAPARSRRPARPRPPAQAPQPARAPQHTAAGPTPPPAGRTPDAVGQLPDRIGAAVQDLLKPAPESGPGPGRMQGLLDYLLKP
ncbi:MAG: Mammalian cell entry related domain protein [Solirubrobacterales bacterium]|nr:Mammalian cell entry related domain protein [Solirubrobacterales bacterium]